MWCALLPQTECCGKPAPRPVAVHGHHPTTLQAKASIYPMSALPQGSGSLWGQLFAAFTTLRKVPLSRAVWSSSSPSISLATLALAPTAPLLWPATGALAALALCCGLPLAFARGLGLRLSALRPRLLLASAHTAQAPFHDLA